MPAQVSLVKPWKVRQWGQSLVVFDLEPWYNVKKRRKEVGPVFLAVVAGIIILWSLLHWLIRSAVKGGILDAWMEIERLKQNKRGDK